MYFLAKVAMKAAHMMYKMRAKRPESIYSTHTKDSNAYG
jgi:hypothetical protein